MWTFMGIINHEFITWFCGFVGLSYYYVLVSFIKVQLKQIVLSCVADVLMIMSVLLMSLGIIFIYVVVCSPSILF
jgi:hypothetical protein